MESPFENYFGQTDVQQFDMNLKLFLDASEYVLRNEIRMRACIISQHFRSRVETTPRQLQSNSRC